MKKCPQCGNETEDFACFCDKCSYNLKKSKDLPPELKKFNWGACLLTWIWCIGNNCWVEFLFIIVFITVFILILNVFAFVPVAIYLGIKGNEIAYKKYCGSDENFTKIQKNWAKASAVIISVVLTIYYF